MLCGSTVLTVGGSGTPMRSSELARLEDALESATKKREDAEKALSGAESGYADALSKKQAIDEKIYALDVEIEAMEALIAEINKQISEKDEQINAANSAIEKQYEKICSRMRANQERGGDNLLEIIFEADGLSDFLSRLDRYEAMLDYDTKLLKIYEADIQALALMREELEISRRELNMRNLSLLDSREELERALEKASKLVASEENRLETAEEDLKKVAQVELEYSNKREELLLEIKVTTNEKEVTSEYTWPLTSANTRVSSGFGWRIHPVTGKNQHHNGIDIPAPYGTDIMAINDGTVIECSYNYADGYYITVSHGGGVASFYSHLSRYRVAVGDKVKKGQVIANVGSSGYATGPHLNLNIYKNNVAVDPLSVVDPKTAK